MTVYEAGDMAARSYLVTIVALACVVGVEAAQSQQALFRPAPAGSYLSVLSDAPIMLLPDEKREPLRVAARGTTLEIVQDGPEWINVRFQDPQFGLRHGYVQAKYVQRENRLAPIDLSVPIAKPAVAPSQAPEQSQPTPSQPVVPTRQPLLRDGYWFSAGLGLGSITCNSCGGYANGLSGGVAFGGMVNRHISIGGGTTGWYRSKDGVAVTAGTFDFRVRAYPSLYEGFYVNGGVGFGGIGVSVGNLSVTENGLGLVYGVGWDFRVGRRVSVTPFWNGAMINVSETFYFGQVGAGITIH